MPVLGDTSAGLLSILALVVLLALVYVPLGDYLAAVLTPTRHNQVERVTYRVIGWRRRGRWHPERCLCLNPPRPPRDEPTNVRLVETAERPRRVGTIGPTGRIHADGKNEVSRDTPRSPTPASRPPRTVPPTPPRLSPYTSDLVMTS